LLFGVGGVDTDGLPGGSSRLESFGSGIEVKLVGCTLGESLVETAGGGLGAVGALAGPLGVTALGGLAEAELALVVVVEATTELAESVAEAAAADLGGVVTSGVSDGRVVGPRLLAIGWPGMG
jgi:hypothetical protein